MLLVINLQIYERQRLSEYWPAFASVTDAIGQAATEAEAEAQRIADPIQLLTTDAFSTLFDYTKYIRLAANAGVVFFSHPQNRKIKNELFF